MFTERAFLPPGPGGGGLRTCELRATRRARGRNKSALSDRARSSSRPYVCTVQSCVLLWTTKDQSSDFCACAVASYMLLHRIAPPQPVREHCPLRVSRPLAALAPADRFPTVCVLCGRGPCVAQQHPASRGHAAPVQRRPAGTMCRRGSSCVLRGVPSATPRPRAHASRRARWKRTPSAPRGRGGRPPHSSRGLWARSV